MGISGPLPNPTLHLVNGRKPTGRPERLPPFRPTEPRWQRYFGANKQLTADARAEWRSTVADLIARGKVSKPDVTALIDMCVVAARVLECERELSTNGLVIAGVNGPAKNPAATILNQYRGALQRYRSDFGLTPVARVRLGDTEPEPPEDDSDLDET
jgi:P27 family predicted phage terminase small subunit